MKTRSRSTATLRGLLAALLTLSSLPGAHAADSAVQEPKTIPFDQLGTEAQKQYKGDGIGITLTAGGARLRAIMQRLEGEATAEGLWLSSTAEEDAGRVNRFRVRAVEMGRLGRMSPLGLTGVVQASTDTAVWLRPGLAEEYTVSSEGVRQDFVVAARPAGTGALAVELEVAGAWAQEAAYGATLTLAATGRALAYHRLRVSDATGRELAARLEVPATDRLRVVVEDAGAVYPVRIDPTFSDADWVSLNPGIPGANSTVRAMVVDGSGNLYVGGDFPLIGTVVANRIAKWNGSAWSALGSGVAGGSFPSVYALAVIGSDLYAGGRFTKAGGVNIGYGIAKWNGSAWSALGTGMDHQVNALAVIGSDLYAGGNFDTAGGTSANYIAKWNGSAWSALGTGMNGGVGALAVIGSDLYAGGGFTTAGGTSANYIAKWNGSAWSALGTGMYGGVGALAFGSTGHLYLGGSFIFAGTTLSPFIAQANLISATPDIAVTQAGPVADGGSVAFGTQTVGSSGTPLTFTITNPGTADLTTLAVTGGTGEFAVSALSTTTVTPGGPGATFTVTFTPSATGPRTATLQITSNVTGTKNPYAIVLNGTGQSVFTAWAVANGVANDPVGLGVNRLKNLLNLAFGVNPVTGGPGALVYTGTFAGNGAITATGQPMTMSETVANSVEHRAVFVRRKDYLAAGLTYTVQFSASLSNWQDSTVVPTVLADDGSHQIVSVPYPALIAGEPARFFRISVSLAP